jgi:hypothetical protein
LAFFDLRDKVPNKSDESPAPNVWLEVDELLLDMRNKVFVGGQKARKIGPFGSHAYLSQVERATVV